jgi:hypothetical protein
MYSREKIPHVVRNSPFRNIVIADTYIVTADRIPDLGRDAGRLAKRRARHPGRVLGKSGFFFTFTSRNSGTLSPHAKSYRNMGRSFLSVRQGVNIIADRWERSAKKWKCGKKMAELAKRYSSESFMGCNDPLEAVLFSASVELQKMWPDREKL